MAKAKTKTKAKAKRKTGGDRNATPKLKTCPFVANMTRPHTTESSGKLATKVGEFLTAKAGWKVEVRAAFAGKTALPEFPVKSFVNPNTGQLSRSAQEAADVAYDEAVEAGTKTPACLPRYNPVLVDLIHAMHCRMIRRGPIKTHSSPPKDWDEKANGNWWHEWKEDGEQMKEPSGWFFDTGLPRRCHADRVESLISDPEKNILTFGGSRYVVGTGTHDGAACFMVNQTSHGNYFAGDKTRKRLSLAGIKEVRNVVFKIEDRPNNGGGVTVKGKWADVRELVFMPGQVLTAGTLHIAAGQQLDAKAIRGLDAKTTGVKFKPLEAPIVGKAIEWDRLWPEIQLANKPAITAMRERGGRSDEYEAGDPQTKSITNMLVNGKRVDPSESVPFGLKAAQIHMVAYIVATGDGKVEEGYFSIGVVVGARANDPYNVGVLAARGGSKAEIAEAETETEAEAPKPKPKPKPKTASKAAAKAKAAADAKKAADKKAADKKAADKKAADKKAADKKAADKKAADKKAKEVDAAPPVEADTADEKDAKPAATEPVTSS